MVFLQGTFDHVTTSVLNDRVTSPLTFPRSTSPSHVQVPSRLALNPAVDATNAGPSIAVIQTSHDVHDTSPGRSLFGTTFCRTRIFSYIGALDPVSYALLSSFSPRFAAPLSSFSSLYLGHRTQDDALRPCAPRRAFGYNSLHCFLYGHRTFSLTSPCGSVAGKTNFRSSFFSLPFLLATLHNIPVF